MVVVGIIILLAIDIIMFYVAYRASYASTKKEWIVYLMPTAISALGILGYIKGYLNLSKKCEENIKNYFLERQISKSNILN